MLRDWMGTWTPAGVPHQTAKLSTAATVAPLDCGPKKPEPGQHLPQPWPTQTPSLTESFVIEQHIDRLLKGVEPTNLGLGTPNAAALIVHIVRGCANDLAVAPKKGQDVDVVLPCDLENASGRAFRSKCLEAARSACPQLCCDMCGTMATPQHEVLAAMRRWLDC